MTEINLFKAIPKSDLPKLLDLHPCSQKHREKLDVTAIIKEVHHNPSSAELKYTFTHCFPCRHIFPLHQAIILKAPTNVIDVLICPIALEEKYNNRTVLDLALNNRPDTSWEAVILLLKKYAEAALERNEDDKIFLHLLLEEGAPLDVISLFLKIWPSAIKEMDCYGQTPLHLALKVGASLDVISSLLNSWPDATKEKDFCSETPLYVACRLGTSFESIHLLLRSCPDAIKVKDINRSTPLHAACEGKASFDIIHLLLRSWPDAINEKDMLRDNPLDLASTFISSLEVFLLLLDTWLDFPENKSIHKVESLRKNARIIIDRLLVQILIFLNDEVNTCPKESMSFFTNIKWQKGVLMFINKYPSIVKTMDLKTNLMASFLSAVGKCCSLATMCEVIKNEQELLKGVECLLVK